LSADSFEDKALELIKSRSNGVLQSELWKDLNIDSRKCSRVIAKLEDEGKIKRTWETVKGTRTYRISYLPQKKEEPKKAINFELILAGENVAPCIGCTYECEPDYCPDLGNWIELLVKFPQTVPDISVEVYKEEEAPVAAMIPALKAPEKSAKGVARAPKEVAEVKPVKEAKVTKPTKEVKPAKVVKAVAKETKVKKEIKKPKEAAKVSAPKSVKAAKSSIGVKSKPR